MGLVIGVNGTYINKFVFFLSLVSESFGVGLNECLVQRLLHI